MGFKIDCIFYGQLSDSKITKSIQLDKKTCGHAMAVTDSANFIVTCRMDPAQFSIIDMRNASNRMVSVREPKNDDDSFGMCIKTK